ncbi:hypothetical protein SCA6_018947 [Theobroma cacao]
MMDQSNSCLSLRSDWVFNFKPRRMQNKKNLCKLDAYHMNYTIWGCSSQTLDASSHISWFNLDTGKFITFKLEEETQRPLIGHMEQQRKICHDSTVPHSDYKIGSIGGTDHHHALSPHGKVKLIRPKERTIALACQEKSIARVQLVNYGESKFVKGFQQEAQKLLP